MRFHPVLLTSDRGRPQFAYLQKYRSEPECAVSVYVNGLPGRTAQSSIQQILPLSLEPSRNVCRRRFISAPGRMPAQRVSPETGRLPAERERAKSLGVGRSELRKALDRLERQGRIRRYVGKGTFLSTGSESENE